MASGSSMLSGLSGGSAPARAADAAVDDDMGDMDALRRQFARHALRQAAQREFAHGERRRLRIALDAGRGAGEQDGAVALRQHALGRLLRHQEAAEGADRHRLLDLVGIEFDERAARAVAGIVDDHVGRAEGRFDVGEQLRDLGALGRIAGKSLAADLLRQRREIGRAPRRQRDFHAGLGEGPRQRGGKPAPTPTMSAVR